ncbi:MAG: outer membrane lipoprotein LolB [Gammaproteobacteria bacterium]|nr:outer membrane lipoprotein LolB [Gammaproteobacteria bacterium]
MAIGLLALAGCATAPRTDSLPADPRAAWTQRQQALSQQPAWRMTGKLSVQTPEEGWFAGVGWEQRGEHFQIDMRDSFGRVVARIQGDDRRVMLTRHDGSTARAASPETLTRQLFGWALPVSGLRYWVRGLPGAQVDSKALAATRKLDVRGRLKHLEQSGWSVDYQAYQDAEPIALPGKIAVTGHDLRVKLIVETWEMPDVSAQWR